MKFNFKYLVLILLVFINNFDCFGQTKEFVADSTKKVVLKKDTKKSLKDSLMFHKQTLQKVFGIEKFNENETPKVAFIRSMILPGWGQITNNQYLLLPIIYGSATATYYFGIRSNNKQFIWYKNSLEKLIEIQKSSGISASDGKTITGTNLYIGAETKFPKVYAKVGDDYYNLEKIDGIFEANIISQSDQIGIRGPFTQQIIENGANQFRRFRDLSIIGMAVGWTIFAVQANVTAHLKSFDMSENISLKIEPMVNPGFGNASFGGKFVFNFK